MRFDLVDLNLFLHVAEARSITHGAALSHLSLASASERVRGMESALGVALLERGRRGVALTPAGRALAQHARIVAQQVARMNGDLAQYARGFKGRVRVLANTSAASEFLPDAIRTFLARHPTIDIDLEERPSADIVSAIAEGSADVGVAADIVDTGALETFPLAVDRLVAVLPARHALARRRTLAFAELLPHDFIGLQAANALQQHLAAHAQRLGRPLAPRVRLGSFDAICRMVEAGIGVAVVPRTAAERSARTSKLRIARLSDAWALRRLAVCARRFDELPAPAGDFVMHLRTMRIAEPQDLPEITPSG